MSFVRGCSFNVAAGRSSTRNPRTRRAVLTGTRLREDLLFFLCVSRLQANVGVNEDFATSVQENHSVGEILVLGFDTAQKNGAKSFA
jgi:hypothetical protein